MSNLLRTLFLLALPLATLQETPVKPGTDLQIVPFNQLPACAQNCGPLFDVAYSCIPPTKPAADTSCFCKDARTTSVGQAGTANTCSTACTVAADLTAVQTWYKNLCASGGTTPNTGSTGGTDGTAGTDTGSGDTDTSGETGDSTEDGSTVTAPKKQTWIESHYKYVIMIVIIVVAIVGGWIAAAFFRKRYLRKRELNYEMRPPTAPWVTGHSASPYGGGGFGEGAAGKEAAMMTTPMTAAQVKKEKKKWFVNERT